MDKNMEKLIIRNQLEKYTSQNNKEQKEKEQFLRFIDAFDDVLTRNNTIGHFTSSAFVVNEDMDKTLFVHHNIFNGLTSPGGHADGESDLLSVALREVKEETGINVVPYSKDLFAFQVNSVMSHFKNNVYVSSHLHFDVIYLAIAKNEDMDKVRVLENENKRVVWVDLDNAYNDEVVPWYRETNKLIVERVRKL